MAGRTRLGLAAAAVLLSCVGCTGSGSSGPPGPTKPPPAAAALECPGQLPHIGHTSRGLDKQQPWVPVKPRGVHTGGKLTPATKPKSVVICAYVAREPADPARTVLDGDLGTVTADLSRLGGGRYEHACLLYLAGSDFQNFLIGLRFGAEGVVWVSVLGNHCTGSSNGVTVAEKNLRADTQAAYRGGYWDTDPAAVAQCDAASNRGPDDDPVVPGAPTGMTICLASFGGAGWRAFPYPDDPGLRDVINKTYPKQVAPTGCAVSAQQPGGIVVRFSYADRDDAIVAVTSKCANGVHVDPSRDFGLGGTIETFFVDRL